MHLRGGVAPNDDGAHAPHHGRASPGRWSVTVRIGNKRLHDEETHMPAASERQSAGPEVPPQLVPGLRWRRVFRGEERQLSVLRRWIASLLPDSPARDDLSVVATELASNSIQHTASGHDGWFTVEITWHEPIVRVAVADCGGASEPHVVDDPTGERGRGLLLVRGLSVRTGICGDRRGRLVWADVRWVGAEPAFQTGAADCYEAAIRDGQAALARRFSGVPAWFGRATLQWWALPAPGRLVSAPSAQALAALLYRLAEDEIAGERQHRPRIPSRGPFPSLGSPSLTSGAA
jgi:hypothetical protein